MAGPEASLDVSYQVIAVAQEGISVLCSSRADDGLPTL